MWSSSFDVDVIKYDVHKLFFNVECLISIQQNVLQCLNFTEIELFTNTQNETQ